MGGRRSTAICRRLKVTETPFYRWKSKYGGMDVSDAKRLKTLKAENARLKKLVAEQALEIDLLKDLNRGKW